MKIKFAMLMGAAAALGCSAAMADELLVTSEAGKGRSMMALDLATNGQAVGIQAKIALPKGVDASKVDLSGCLSDLPSSHKGNCVMLDGQVLVLVYSDSNEPLPAGVVSIGRVGFAGGKGGELAVTEFLVSDANANPLPATHKVAGPRGAMANGREDQVK